MRATFSRCLVAAAIGCAASGCANTRGPTLVVNSHVDYNNAVSQVMKEELLLNVVRRRYLDAPQFVQVSSISTQIKTGASFSADATLIDKIGNDWDSSTFAGGVTFEDAPTVTITPRQGEDFAAALHAPLSVKSIARLSDGGYNFEKIFWLLVKRVNGLRGVDLSYGKFSDSSGEFREALGLMETLSDRNQLVVGQFRWNDPYTDYAFPADQITPSMWITTVETGNRRWKSYDGGKTFQLTDHDIYPTMWLSDEGKTTAEGKRLMELLNLQEDVQKRVWVMEPARVPEGPDLATSDPGRRATLKLQMRSLYNVINLLSYGVEVPEDDIEDGRAISIEDYHQAVSGGEFFDVTAAFKVHWSLFRPPFGAFISVPYRGGWYSIDDDDIKSKATLNALFDLWQLSIKSESGSEGPALTLPVG